MSAESWGAELAHLRHSRRNGGTRAHHGGLFQLAGVAPVEYVEGGSRSGLRFSAVPDRGMDVQDAEAFGVLVGWRTGAGCVHPAFYNPVSDEWLRTYEGGILTMGGLRQIGDPSEDLGERCGLHGRIARAPAVGTGHWVDWAQGEIRIWVRLSEQRSRTHRIDLERTPRPDPGGARSVSRIAWEPGPSEHPA